MGNPTKIKLTEALGWVAGKLEDWTLGLVPDEGKLEILTERMEQDARQKREKYHKVLAKVCAIENPETPGEGKLPNLRELLEKRENQGKAWGSELSALGDSKGKRANQLRKYLESCADECDRIEGEIAVYEKELAEWTETMELRREQYEAAKRDLKKLKRIAPRLLEQKEALQEAKEARLQAAADAGKRVDSPAGALIAAFERELDEAKAGDAAAEILLDEEGDDTPDLDAVWEAEQEEEAGNERINRWLS